MLQVPLPGAPTVGVFTPARYKVVKITYSYSEVVLRTTKHTMVYLGSITPTIPAVMYTGIVHGPPTDAHQDITWKR
jgi:hypothetical protein